MNTTDQIDKYLESGNNVFLTGAAGTGKTYTINHFFKHSKYSGKIAVTALTGLASLHIKGNTIHRFAGTGIQSDLAKLKLITTSPVWLKKNRRKINNATVVVIDEVSMMRSDYLDFLNGVFQEACGNKLPMGGKKIVFCGDFLQLPPVVKRSENLPNIWAFQSPVWKSLNIKIIELTLIRRQIDKTFSDALNEIRYGRCPQWVDDLMKSREKAPLNSNLEPVKFLAKNDQVDEENERQIRLLPGKEKTYYAEILAENENQENALLKDCIAPERLVLKVGAQVMILKNDYKNNQYINGSMGTVIQIKNTILGPTVFVELDRDGTIVAIARHRWERRDEEGNLVAELLQLPIKLAYAITIHKSQGMTLDLVELDCQGIFAEGQMYVALSRVRSLSGLRLKNWNRKYVKYNRIAVAFYNWLHTHYKS